MIEHEIRTIERLLIVTVTEPFQAPVGDVINALKGSAGLIAKAAGCEKMLFLPAGEKAYLCEKGVLTEGKKINSYTLDEIKEVNEKIIGSVSYEMQLNVRDFLEQFKENYDILQKRKRGDHDEQNSQ